MKPVLFVTGLFISVFVSAQNPGKNSPDIPKKLHKGKTILSPLSLPHPHVSLITAENYKQTLPNGNLLGQGHMPYIVPGTQHFNMPVLKPRTESYNMPF